MSTPLPPCPLCGSDEVSQRMASLEARVSELAMTTGDDADGLRSAWAKVQELEDELALRDKRIGELRRKLREYEDCSQVTAWRVLDLVGSRAVARQVIRLALMTNTDPIELATRCVEEDE